MRRPKLPALLLAAKGCRFLALLPLLTLLPGCHSKTAPVPEPELPVVIHLETSVYQLPRALAVAEVFDRPKNTDYAAVLKRVQALVAEKKATLVTTSASIAISGARCVAESTLEHRYPTEFDPPQIPQQFGANTDSPKKTTTKTVTTSVSVETSDPFPKSSTTPTTFETRNCGMVVAWEPVYQSKSDTISFNGEFQLVDLLRTVKYPADGGTEVEQPVFYSRKLTTGGTMKNGATMILGTLEPDKSASKDEDMTDVVFVHAATW